MSTCCPETTYTPRAFTGTLSGSFSGSFRGVAHLVQLLKTWQAHQRFRRDLRRLPDYLLRDIGLDVTEAHEESRKPFWQA
ncbi:MAG: hypothetical protein Tsb0032_32000 [Kiloniellaceae bacterium]